MPATFDFSLRTRLFLGFGGLVVLLVLAQAWLVRSLTEDLGEELDFVALEVGTSVASFFSFDCAEGEKDCDHESSFVWTNVRPGDPLEASDESEDENRPAPAHGPKPERPSSESSTKKKVTLHIVRTVDEDGKKITEEFHLPHDRALVELEQEEEERDSNDPADEQAGRPQHTERRQTNQRFMTLRDQDVNLHVAGDVDTRVLMLEGSDLAGAIPIPRLGLRQKVSRFEQRLWLGSGLLLLLGLLVAGYSAHRVATPLARLADTAEQVGGGALGVEVETSGGGREVRRTVAAFNDMSRRLAVLDQRNRHLEALRQLEEIGDIARGMAHSLRNPLNALGLSVEELAGRASNAQTPDTDLDSEPDTEDDTDDERSRQLVATARRQIHRLDAGIRSFLLLASPGDATGTESVALDELVRDIALEALQDAGGRVGIDLELEEVTLTGVVAELRAIVQALVVNAVEASPQGQRVRLRLIPSTGPTGGTTIFEVDDRGPGLPREVRDRLFTPHLSTKASGSGMGLFLTERIARHRYGGRLELLDRDGGGTRARLELGPRRLTGSGGLLPELSAGETPEVST